MSTWLPVVSQALGTHGESQRVHGRDVDGRDLLDETLRASIVRRQYLTLNQIKDAYAIAIKQSDEASSELIEEGRLAVVNPLDKARLAARTSGAAQWSRHL